MPTYQFRCQSCGDFDRRYSLADVPAESSCPRCESASRRMITAVGLTAGGSPSMRVLDATKRSASEPTVVNGPLPSPRHPAPRRRAVPTDPRHSTLPRP